MAARTDAALAAVALVAFGLAAVLVDATLAAPFVVVGGVGTLVFELLATRGRAAVRRRWERPAVQVGALAVAVATAVVGALLAPSAVISAGVGALGTYLLVLGGVVAARRVRNAVRADGDRGRE